jgi:hypothetical protein
MPRLNVQLADSQALNVNIPEPSFSQAKSSHSENSNRKSADSGSPDGERTDSSSAQRNCTSLHRP